VIVMHLRLRLALIVLAVAVCLVPAASPSLNTRSMLPPLPYYGALRMYAQPPASVNIDGLLGPTYVAVVNTAVVGVEYCSTAGLVVTPGGPAPVLPGDADIACGNLGSYTFPAGCLTFTGSVVGDLVVDQAVDLRYTTVPASPCNSQVGNPGTCAPGVWMCGGFVSEVCIRVDIFDTLTGIKLQEEDTDWFLDMGPLTTPADTAWMATNQPDLNSLGLQGTSGAC
jgi:hypothetical protein